MQEKVTIKLDASACKKSACGRHLYFDVIEGLKQPGYIGISLHYGSSCHKFAEVYPQNKDVAASMAMAHTLFRSKVTDNGSKEWLNINHLTGSCMALKDWIDGDSSNEYYVNPVDNKLMCEVRFGLPYMSFPHCDILLCGTIDKVSKFKRGATVIGDYKTTATYKKDDYFTQYRLDPQMMLYRHALEWYAKHTKDNILAEIGSQKIGCYIDAIFLSKTKDTEIQRSPVMFYSDSEMEDFIAELVATCYKLAKWTEDKVWPNREGMFNGACTHLYGPCKYFSICSAPDKIAADAMIKNYFIQKPYDPLSY